MGCASSQVFLKVSKNNEHTTGVNTFQVVHKEKLPALTVTSNQTTEVLQYSSVPSYDRNPTWDAIQTSLEKKVQAKRYINDLVSALKSMDSMDDMKDKISKMDDVKDKISKKSLSA